MADARLQAELEESKQEIRRLRESLSLGTPTVHKDISLVSLVPKWSGAEMAVPLDEVFANIDGATQIGRWKQSDIYTIYNLYIILNNFHCFVFFTPLTIVTTNKNKSRITKVN